MLKIFYSLWEGVHVLGCSPDSEACGASAIAWQEYQISPALPFRAQEEVLCVAEETYKYFNGFQWITPMRKGDILFGHIEKIYPNGIHVPEFWDQKGIVWRGTDKCVLSIHGCNS